MDSEEQSQSSLSSFFQTQSQERTAVQLSQASERYELELYQEDLRKLASAERAFGKTLRKNVKKYLQEQLGDYYRETVQQILEETETSLENAGKQIDSRRAAFLDAYDQFFDPDGDEYQERLELETEVFLETLDDEAEKISDRYYVYNELRKKVGLTTLEPLDNIVGEMIIAMNRERIAEGEWDLYINYQLSPLEMKKIERMIKKKFTSEEGQEFIQELKRQHGQELRLKMFNDFQFKLSLAEDLNQFLISSLTQRELDLVDPLVIENGLGLAAIGFLF